MAKWEELNMADRAAYMRIAVKNGYRDIRSIREAYNKYEDGGDKGQSSPTDFRRVRENDTPATKKESTVMEDDINRRQKSMYYTAKNKGYDSKDYYIPYIPEKEIKVPGIGRVSSNMLDSLAVNAERAGISLVDAIGLAARETKFGAIPNYSLKAVKDAYFKKYGKEMPEDAIKATERTALNSSVARNFGGIHPQFLINDHEWFQRGWGIKSLDKIKSPLEHGFRLFKMGKYNTGESDHTSKVRKEGNAVFNTPAVQKWYKEYNKYAEGGNSNDEESLTDFLKSRDPRNAFLPLQKEHKPDFIFSIPPIPTIVKEDTTGKFKVPSDNSEYIFVTKANNITRKKHNEVTANDLKSKSKEDIINIQKELANEGYYDTELKSGKNKESIPIQKLLVREELLSRDDIDGNIGPKTITALQKLLVKKGYLPEYTDSGDSNIDGILGKNTREAYKLFNRENNIDGVAGPKTISAYIQKENKKNKGYNIEVSAEGMTDQCARWVSKKVDTVTGMSRQLGVYGNAWNMLTNIRDSGGEMLYNVYEDPSFDNVKSSKELKNATRSALKNHTLDYSKLLVGDIVGIYMPSSTHHKDVLEEGTTYNTHVGIVVDIKDGIPIVEHNILGKVRRELINKISGSLFGNPAVTVAARPKQGERILPLKFKNVKSSYTIPKEKRNPLMDEYMDSLASAKETFKDIYTNVDLDFVEKAAIAITKRETDFMNNKPSDNKYNPSFIARNIVHSVKDTPEDIRSQDLTKMKFNALNSTYRTAIGLNSPEDLSSNPTITGRAVMLLLSKNYDYFYRLAKLNPDLNLTKEDIENATILSYNRGMRSISTLGFNKDGSLNLKELKYLRNSSKKGAKEKDITSTNLKYLRPIFGDFVDDYYNKYGEPHTPYVSAAREALELISKKTR